MSSELDRLRQELREVKRLRLAEQQRRQEDQFRFQRRTRKTNLAEFLDACHQHLYHNLAIQDASQSTQGTPVNGDRKLRPRRIVPWTDFPTHQVNIWNVLMESDFVLERHFTSRHTLEENGEQLQRQQLSSELDLQYFIQFAIHDQVTSIIEHLSQHAVLQQSLNLQGTIRFENHGNMLTPVDPATNLTNLTISQPQPRRRSPRLREQSHQTSSDTRYSPPRPSQIAMPRADQFCVYSVYSVTNDAGDVIHRTPVLIMEYKAAHKLTLGHIYTGLNEMDLDDIVQEKLDEDIPQRCQRLVAAVLTQAFAYMIAARLEFSYVFTGEALIFLRVPEDDCSCLQYALAVPQGDVGPTTGWTEGLEHDNRLHLTAVGQLLAFTLRAIQSPRRDLRWQRVAEAQLETWQVFLQELQQDIPDEKVPGSEYRPPQGESAQYLRDSPIRRRLRPREPVIINDEEHMARRAAISEDDSSDNDGRGHGQTPSRPPADLQRGRAQGGLRRGRATTDDDPSSSTHRSHRQRELGPYCSALCLKGLVENGDLDSSCPNVHLHGCGPKHQLRMQEFRRLVRQILQKDLEYCEELYLWGARGVLYRLRLPHWGYTVVAKGTRPEFVMDLQHEAKIYRKLRSIQGIHVPVYLGSYTLDRPLQYAGSVPIVHMMVLSFGGYSLNHLRTTPATTDTAIDGLLAIHKLGILHRDVARRNMLWDSMTGRIIWHDFGQAKVYRPRLRTPAARSVDRRGVPDFGQQYQCDAHKKLASEISKALAELRR
ncbi:hypothetical protein AYO20_05615 [Fonsecaea nubica]|uniref:Protein kinase domain-containing protein n=1 Tax=Fonsecaea nubica TaxID=856822 RepID=A0A178CZ72_9EURO|nr:hypothetical protein AYO20_05615 [Fonsecaea nubica]OAL35138.1 hypothetical protein AYO20_05615 [Fonsecaea nubica]